MEKFRRYNSIENSYRTKTINYIQEYGYDVKDIEWVATEKIHGANFSLWYDGSTFKTAKRSSFNGENENFYNSQLIYVELQNKIITLFEELETDDLSSVVLYGELYGGGYNHADVEKLNIKRIQSGVDYRPDVGFYAFDLYVNDSLVDNITFSNLMETVGFQYAKSLRAGTFAEVMELPNEFQTTIPTQLGLPEIENNIAEGLVLKPTKPLFFDNGSRVILKSKNAKFSEKDNSKKQAKVYVQISEEIKECFDIANTYITENRLRNVISKYGEFTQRDFGKLTGLFIKDVLEDLMKEHKMEDLEKADRKTLNKLVGKECSNVIRANFLNIIDGVF